MFFRIGEYQRDFQISSSHTSLWEHVIAMLFALDLLENLFSLSAAASPDQMCRLTHAWRRHAQSHQMSHHRNTTSHPSNLKCPPAGVSGSGEGPEAGGEEAVLRHPGHFQERQRPRSQAGLPGAGQEVPPRQGQHRGHHGRGRSRAIHRDLGSIRGANTPPPPFHLAYVSASRCRPLHPTTFTTKYCKLINLDTIAHRAAC